MIGHIYQRNRIAKHNHLRVRFGSGVHQHQTGNLLREAPLVVPRVSLAGGALGMRGSHLGQSDTVVYGSGAGYTTAATTISFDVTNAGGA